MGPISIAAAGMSTAVTRFNRASRNLVESLEGKGDVAPETAIAEQIEAKAQFKASAIVVRAADDMMGTLLDINV